MALWSFMNMLLVIIWSQHFFEAPQVGETRCLAPSRIEAPGQCRSWRPPRRLSRAEAPQPRRSRSAPQSAAACCLRRFFSGKAVWPDEGAKAEAPLGDDESGGNAELHPFNRQTNDECFGLHIFKTVQGKKTFTNALKKHIEQVSRSFKASFLQHYLII